MEVGGHVVLRCSNGRIHVIQLHDRAAAKLGRARKTRLAPLLGQPYGALFALLDNENLLQRVGEPAPAQPAAEPEHQTETGPAANPSHAPAAPPDDLVAATTSNRDNRNLVDDQAHQQMNSTAILAIKQSGGDVQHLVAQLAANSSTFASKTRFAQDKYVERKSAKHLLFVRACAPTPGAVAEAYFQKNPEKIAHIRVDSLSMVITLAGLRLGAQVLMVDEMNGLLVGAVAERVLIPNPKGKVSGRVLSGFFGNSPPALSIAKMMDFDTQVMCAITHFEMKMVEHFLDADEGQLDMQAIQYTTGIVHTPEERLSGEDESYVATPIPATLPLARPNDSSDAPSSKRTRLESKEKKVFGPEVAMEATKVRRIAMREARPMRGVVKTWIKAGSDSLLISLSPDGSGSLTERLFYAVEQLLPRLLAGGVLVVFCAYMQPLADLYSAFQSDAGLRLLKRVELMETHLHQHQILRGRTHPAMSDSASGGFLLTGIKLMVDQGPKKVEPAPQP